MTGRYMKVYGPYLGAVLQRLMLDFDTLAEQSPDGSLERPVKIVIDEFPAMGRLNGIVEAVNLARKRRISILIAAQTLAQSDGTSVEYFAYDGLGSVRQLVDVSASVGLAQTFDPYGNGYAKAGSAQSTLGYTDEVTSKIPGGVSLRGPTPVGNYPQGASPFGVMAMSGNIWEWCLNEYDTLKNTSLVGSNWRTVRGGSRDFSSKLASVVGHTNAYYPSGRFYGTGFRVHVGHFPPF